jgi:hypothetical protein
LSGASNGSGGKAIACREGGENPRRVAAGSKKAPPKFDIGRPSSVLQAAAGMSNRPRGWQFLDSGFETWHGGRGGCGVAPVKSDTGTSGVFCAWWGWQGRQKGVFWAKRGSLTARRGGWRVFSLCFNGCYVAMGRVRRWGMPWQGCSVLGRGGNVGDKQGRMENRRCGRRGGAGVVWMVGRVCVPLEVCGGMGKAMQAHTRL